MRFTVILGLLAAFGWGWYIDRRAAWRRTWSDVRIEAQQYTGSINLWYRDVCSSNAGVRDRGIDDCNLQLLAVVGATLRQCWPR